MFSPTNLPDVLIATLRRHGDDRGFFSETFRESWLRDAGVEVDFIQDNQAFSKTAGVVRGLHYQIGTAAQGKLIRAVRGAILDVAVDVRAGSPTFGRHVAMELTAQNGRVAWIPVGFAHGYLTLEPDTDVLYKTTSYYDQSAERGLAFDDPDLGIAWPVARNEMTVSAKDLTWPSLAHLKDVL